MPTIDDSVEVALSTSITVAKLSAQLVLASMEKFLAMVKNNPKSRDTSFQDGKTPQGKMNIKKLFEKHNKDEILTLKDNISKAEYSAIKKEFNKMGVDFSMRKVAKDEYSIFYAGKDVASIEKGMDNAIKKYSRKQEKKQHRFNMKNLCKQQKEKDKAERKEKKQQQSQKVTR